MTKILFLQLENLEFFVENGNPMGGSAVETFVWINAFKELGFEIYQAKLENDHRAVLKEYDWIKTIPIYDENKRRKMVWYTYRFPSIFRALKASKCDYVYTSIPKWFSFYIGICCRLMGKKHIVRIASDNMMDDRIYLNHKMRYIKTYISMGFRLADFILPQNQYQLDTLKKKFPNKKILKIFNPIVVNRTFLNVKTRPIGYIAWVANFRDVKNLPLLFKIASILPNEQFKIAGVGAKSGLDRETEESITKLRTLKNVEFVGSVPREEILSFFSNSKFLINTSKYEGFSNTFLEAMVTGTPILTTKNVNPDGIIDGFSLGLIYDNEHHLVQLLSSLSIDAYKELSKNCVSYVTQNHDHLGLGKRLIDFIQT
jgi:glycosyltransferase involved in cell wall biosynthesis